MITLLNGQLDAHHQRVNQALAGYIGALPFNQSQLVMAMRYASGKGLSADPLLASAGLDRLFHNAHALVITGDSFRARGRRRLSGEEAAAAAAASSPESPLKEER